MTIKAVSKNRYRASAAEKRRYGGSTVTEFYVFRSEDERDASKWKVVIGYGPAPGERKTDAIRRSGLLETGLDPAFRGASAGRDQAWVIRDTRGGGPLFKQAFYTEEDAWAELYERGMEPDEFLVVERIKKSRKAKASRDIILRRTVRKTTTRRSIRRIPTGSRSLVGRDATPSPEAARVTSLIQRAAHEGTPQEEARTAAVIAAKQFVKNDLRIVGPAPLRAPRKKLAKKKSAAKKSAKKRAARDPAFRGASRDATPDTRRQGVSHRAHAEMLAMARMLRQAGYDQGARAAAATYHGMGIGPAELEYRLRMGDVRSGRDSSRRRAPRLRRK